MHIITVWKSMQYLAWELKIAHTKLLEKWRLSSHFSCLQFTAGTDPTFSYNSTASHVLNWPRLIKYHTADSKLK